MLNLMYITNKPEVAKIAEDVGVDWIFIDMEFIGKDSRQGGLDTVQNHHTVEDVKIIRKAITKAKLLVRVNPIHKALENYPSSKEEIDAVIEAGADIIMLPFFKTVEAADLIVEILEVPGIDMIHLGLNDLHLEKGMKFMFELLADGTVDMLGGKIKAKGIPFGFGGIATLDGGALPGSMVLKEHVRLGSTMVIVSRSFCNTDVLTDLDEVRAIFQKGIKEIRDLEVEVEDKPKEYFDDNHKEVVKAVQKIISI